MFFSAEKLIVLMSYSRKSMVQILHALDEYFKALKFYWQTE